MFIAGSRGPISAGIAPDRAVKIETTGRSLVLMRQDPGAMQAGIKTLQSVAGLNAIRASEANYSLKVSDIGSAAALVLDHIGVAVINGDPEQVGRLSIQAARSDSILAVEPERVVYAAMLPATARASGRAASPATQPGGRLPRAAAAAITREYLRGYRDGFEQAANLCLEGGAPPQSSARAVEAVAFNQTAATWGLQITRVIESPYSGRGIRMAVLDTGFEFDHPDFNDRNIMRESFIEGESPQDAHGHGTHCVGTSMGPLHPGTLPRYGVAYDAEIFVGKVLSNQGRGGDGGILAGIDWAVAQGCRVVSMSLGSPTLPGQKPSTVFENMARRALAAGTLIVAAAGNESERPGYIAPVGHPANCASVMAVGAIDSATQIAWFSTRGIDANGGQVDIAGPGVDIYSAWIKPQFYNVISGTSMATPHVAGIAALHAEANPGISPVDLWTRLVKTARSLPLPPEDVGSGLVQAPV